MSAVTVPDSQHRLLIDVALAPPSTVSYDGESNHAGTRLLHFTERNIGSPSWGASFCIDPEEVLADAIAAERADVRTRFAEGRGARELSQLSTINPQPAAALAC